MTGIYERMGARAQDLLGRYSQDQVTLRKVDSSYDPATGTKAETLTDYVVDAVGSDFAALERAGGLIQATDFELIVAANSLDAVPTADWRVIIDGATYEVARVETVPPIGTAVLHKLQVRQ